MTPEQINFSLSVHIFWLTLFYAITRVTIWLAVWGWALFGPVDDLTYEEVDRLTEQFEAKLKAKSVNEIDVEHY